MWIQLCARGHKSGCSPKEIPLFLQKKPEVPPPSTNPFLEDEAGGETDEIVMEKSDTDKVSL